MCFTAWMKKVFCQFNDFCFFHMDDVLVHDASQSDHLEHLKLIFQNIREVGMRLKLSMNACRFLILFDL